MKACVDVAYRAEFVVAACVLFQNWPDDRAAHELTAALPPSAEPYVPGQFYKRELPALLRVLTQATEPLEVVIVDGYVWLDTGHTPGLGAHLHTSLGGAVPVIGVAKTRFRGAPALEVQRGQARRPLYVTAVGVEPDAAARAIHGMHGAERIPTLLRRVDWLSRSTAAQSASHQTER